VRIFKRIVASISSSSFSASHADQSSVLTGTHPRSGLNNGSVRSPQCAAALLHAYVSALLTIRARTGFLSTYYFNFKRVERVGVMKI
jgi:hypothetical protein